MMLTVLSPARRLLRRCLVLGVAIALWLSLTTPAQAASIDPFIRRYFDAAEPVALPANAAGETQLFSAEDFAAGKEFFSSTCINCHVGGATLPNPTESLALDVLKGATPSRDNIQAIVAFMRQPMTYDGQEVSFWCREVPATWLSDAEAETVAAFVLRAAEKAPGWGTSEF